MKNILMFFLVSVSMISYAQKVETTTKKNNKETKTGANAPPKDSSKNAHKPALNDSLKKKAMPSEKDTEKKGNKPPLKDTANGAKNIPKIIIEKYPQTPPPPKSPIETAKDKAEIAMINKKSKIEIAKAQKELDDVNFNNKINKTGLQFELDNEEQKQKLNAIELKKAIKEQSETQLDKLKEGALVTKQKLANIPDEIELKKAEVKQSEYDKYIGITSANAHMHNNQFTLGIGCFAGFGGQFFKGVYDWQKQPSYGNFVSPVNTANDTSKYALVKTGQTGPPLGIALTGTLNFKQNKNHPNSAHGITSGIGYAINSDLPLTYMLGYSLILGAVDPEGRGGQLNITIGVAAKQVKTLKENLYNGLLFYNPVHLEYNTDIAIGGFISVGYKLCNL